MLDLLWRWFLQIKSSVSGEVTILPRSAVPLLLTSREPASESETKRKHSSGPSSSSPSSELNRGNSPTDPYSELLRLESSSSLSSFLNMEVLSLRESTDERPTSVEEMFEPQIVVVVVDATKELQLGALQYALENFVRPGDNLYLLGIVHQVLNPMGYKQKATSGRFIGTTEHKIEEERSKRATEFQKCILSDPELQKLYDLKQVIPDVRVVAGPDRKVVTAHWAVELRATRVILGKNLRRDKSYLKEQLDCNIMLMKSKNDANVIKVVPKNSPGHFQEDLSIDIDPSAALTRQSMESSPRGFTDSSAKRLVTTFNPIRESSGASDSSVSPELRIRTGIFYTRQLSTSTEFNSSPPQLPDLGEEEIAAEPNQDLKSEMVFGGVQESSPGKNSDPLPEDDTRSSLLSSAEMVISAGSPPSDRVTYKVPGRPMSTGDLQSLMARPSAATVFRPAPRSASDRAGDELMNILNPPKSPPGEIPAPNSIRTLRTSLREEHLAPQTPTMDNEPIGRLSKFGNEIEDNRLLLDNSTHGRKKNPRPFAPLCSVCNHPGPVFGSEAIKFTYAQLEEATNNFDQENYLAEGGYGFVYRGRLPGGQEIAVKQYKAASSQGDDEFFSEVEVLKHAQHRNLVILIGYCKENHKRLLVYEFVCNKSLDVHLSAKNPNVLEWKSRWKIAVGAVRGLRYLHEECRVGCIVHRDLRPNNILLTHDFVPMVGDFGLARSQPSGDDPEETRVIGTLGYLAPEYAESGSITEKADVYSFGVVLLELITGRKAIDATRARGETCLTEWARPLIHAGKREEIVDPRLENVYDIDQVNKMIDAAGLCISKDPCQRPRTSEVLRMLERDTNSGSMIRGSSSNDLNDISRNPSTQRLIQASKPIPRQGSLDSIHAKASAKMTMHVSKDCSASMQATVAIPRAKTPKEALASERASSPHPHSTKPSTNSPGGKSSAVHSSPYAKSKSKKGTHSLKYAQML